MTDKKDFTHYGWLYGVVPIYVNVTNSECPDIESRHWVFEPLMLFVDLAYSFTSLVGSMIFKDFEPMFAIKLTGRIHRDGDLK